MIIDIDNPIFFYFTLAIIGLALTILAVASTRPVDQKHDKKSGRS